MQTCPCGSGRSYEECCQPFHLGKEPPTALLLMKSRYSAYAKKLPEYIQKTTHPKSPYFETDRKKWRSAILEFCRSTEFVKLEIFGFGEDWVHFEAHLIQAGKPLTLIEKSLFARLEFHWRYVSGEITVSG